MVQAKTLLAKLLSAAEAAVHTIYYAHSNGYCASGDEERLGRIISFSDETFSTPQI